MFSWYEVLDCVHLDFDANIHASVVPYHLVAVWNKPEQNEEKKIFKNFQMIWWEKKR